MGRIAPVGVIKDPAVQDRIGLSLDQITLNLKQLNADKDKLKEKALKVISVMNLNRESDKSGSAITLYNVDTKLYNGFFTDKDKSAMTKVKNDVDISNEILKDESLDPRLKLLIPLYKARNYPDKLTSAEIESYETYRINKLTSSNAISDYFLALQKLSESNLSKQQQFLIEELRLYGESNLQ